MTTLPLSAATWRKSSYSSDCTGNCVEIAEFGPSVGIRDSKRLHGPTLTVSRDAFSGFLTQLGAEPPRS